MSRPRRSKVAKSKLPIIIGIVVGLFVIVGVILFFVLRDNKITITFMDETKVVGKQEIKKGGKVTFPKITKEGYELEGWYNDDVKVTDKTKFKEDTTLVIHWLKEDAKTMVITYDTDGGDKIEPMTIECDSALKLPKPTKKGYKFVDWRDKNDVVISNETKLTCEDIKLKAKWEKEEVSPTATTKPAASSKKEYTCPDGYTLSGDKCTITVDAEKYCGSGEIMIGDSCYGSRRDVARCNSGGKWAYSYDDHQNRCFYDETDSYMYESSCSASGNYWIDGLCYTRKEEAANVCESTWVFIDAHQIPGYGTTPNIVDGCYQKRSLQYRCEDDTYTMSDNKCTKTIDATLK